MDTHIVTPLDLAALRGLCEERKKIMHDAALPGAARGTLWRSIVLTAECAAALPAAVAEIERLRARVAELESAATVATNALNTDACDGQHRAALRALRHALGARS